MRDGSLSDIYYHEESNTIKNHKHEVIVYFDDHWNVLTDNLNDTYCKEIVEAIVKTFQGSKESAEDLILLSKKRISKIKKEKIQSTEQLKDAAIALDLNPENLKPIHMKISKFLKDKKINYEKINNPHVSTAYLLGHNKFSDLANLVKTISHYDFEFKVTGIDVLSGCTTNKDYLVLKVEAPESFYKALQAIEEESDIMKFPGGFKTHISLYSIEKGMLKQEDVVELKNKIEKQQFTLNHQISLKPNAVSVFNNSKLLELRQKIKQNFDE